MELNLLTLAYLFFRLAPFIIVCYFSLASLFNQDMKGFIYLIGLLFACFITFLVGETAFSQTIPTTGATSTSAVCNLITIGKLGSFSKLPLGITILTYTFFYLLYIIISKHFEMFNIPTLIFFPTLILSDLTWNIMHGCYPVFAVFTSLLLGAIMGLIWARLIDQLNDPTLLFLNIGSNQSACQRPSKQLFKCTFPATTTPPS